MKWIPANQPPPKKYHSDAMTYIPLLLAFDDEKELRERKHAVMGMFIGGLLMEWRIDGSPSSFHPTHWMPCPLTPKHMPKRVRYTGPKLPCSTCNGHGSYQEGGTLSLKRLNAAILFECHCADKKAPWI